MPEFSMAGLLAHEAAIEAQVRDEIRRRAAPAADELRDAYNLCGDDVGCQCEEAEAISARMDELVLSPLMKGRRAQPAGAPLPGGLEPTQDELDAASLILPDIRPEALVGVLRVATKNKGAQP